MNTSEPLFSIITVCLNPGADLARTVESVLSQGFSDFEYLVKDGVSQDGTQDFECSDQRVQFVSRADDGVYDAMNQALELCSGRYVNFLNAGDTFCVPSALRDVADLLEEQGYPSIAYTDRYNEKLGVITRYPDSLSSWDVYRRPVCHQTLFVERSLLLAMGGFDTRFRILADYDLLMKLVLGKRVRYVHCPVVAVNYKDDGISSDPKNYRQKRKELRRLRRYHFGWTQRVLYGFLWRMTLPCIRIRLVQQNRFPWLRRVALCFTKAERAEPR